MQLRRFTKIVIRKETAIDDPVLPNYLGLLACILHKKLTVAKALTLMELSSHMESETMGEQVKAKRQTGRHELGGVKC